jgi:hypothetical protein
MSASKRRALAMVVCAACLALAGLMAARELGGRGDGRAGPGSGAGGAKEGARGEERNAGDLVRPDW